MIKLSKATNAKIVSTIADLKGGESYSHEWLGHADVVNIKTLGNDEIMFVEGCDEKCFATIMIEGANTYILDEIERSLHDTLCAVKRVLEGHNVLPGGGAVESNVFVFLDNLAAKLCSRLQLGMAAFADALLTIPKTLAVNAAKD